MIVLLSAALFSLGLYGVLTRKDMVAVLAAIEVMLTGVMVFVVGVGASSHLPLAGAALDRALASQVTAIVFLTLAAAEAVVGIALVLVLVRRAGLERTEELGELRG